MEVAKGEASGDLLSSLPAHLAAQVLCKLHEPVDVISAAGVCWQWRHAALDEATWRQLFCGRFLWGDPLPLPRHPAAAGSVAVPYPALPPPLLLGDSWRRWYAWRHGVDLNWRRGTKRLLHSLDAHESWVNSVRLAPQAGLVVSGCSEGTLHVWSYDGELLLSGQEHHQAIWCVEAGEGCALSAGMDGFVRCCDLATGAALLACPLGWRGPPGPVQPDDWENLEAVTTLQFSLDGRLVLAGCMDGALSLLDLRTGAPVTALSFVAPPRGAAGPGERYHYWAPRRGRDALCCARLHEHLVVAGGDAPAVALFDLRAAGGTGGSPCARLAELAVPTQGPRRPKVHLWDLSRLDGVPCSLQMPLQHAAGAGEPPSSSSSSWVWQQQQQGSPAGAPAAVSWPSPPAARRVGAAAGDAQEPPQQDESPNEPALRNAQRCLAASNQRHLNEGLPLGAASILGNLFSFSTPQSNVSNFHQLSALDIDKRPVDFSTLDGKASLTAVNYKFGWQEPGTNEEIKKFAAERGFRGLLMDKVCATTCAAPCCAVPCPALSGHAITQHITPLQINVNGNDASPVYQFLKVASGDTSPILWNFAKQLVGDADVTPKPAPSPTPAPALGFARQIKPGRAAARPAWAQPRGVLLPKSSEGLFGADGGEDSCALGADASNVITADIAEGGHARPADSHITVQGPPRKRGRLASPRATPGFGLTAGAASYCFSYGGSCSVLACEEDEEEGEEATGPCAPLPLPIKIRPPAVVGTALATAYVRAASPLRLPLKRGAAPEEQQGAIELPRGQLVLRGQAQAAQGTGPADEELSDCESEGYVTGPYVRMCGCPHDLEAEE
eukprot:scaffold9.g3224.t1